MSQVLVPGDVTYTFRGLLCNKGFAVAALLTLGLGIGANAAMFSVVSAVLLRSLPYSDPDRIVLIWETKRHLQRESDRSGRNRQMCDGRHLSSE